jgi:DNA/RNA endonuclease YhcR with UshA esterase domain
MSRKSSAIAIAALVACVAVHVATPAVADDMLTPDQAPLHIGENATVCGVVASTRYAAGTKGQPTFLNFDLPYPRQIFAVVIWGSDRPKFGTPETTLMGKRTCATGVIQSFRGKAEIIAADPRQLVVQQRR